MESCTGGLLASTLTDVPGSSEYFQGGFVSYQTELKIELASAPQSSRSSASSALNAPGPWRARRGRSSKRAWASVSPAWRVPTSRKASPSAPCTSPFDSIWAPPQTTSYVFAQGRTAVKRRAVTTALVMLRQALLGHRPEALV